VMQHSPRLGAIVMLLACVFAVASSMRADDSDISSSIARGVHFLVKDQQPDGSWGTGTQTNGFEVYSMVPGSMDAYRIGASALCVMALREAGETDAHDKGLNYLLTVPDA